MLDKNKIKEISVEEFQELLKDDEFKHALLDKDFLVEFYSESNKNIKEVLYPVMMLSIINSENIEISELLTNDDKNVIYDELKNKINNKLAIISLLNITSLLILFEDFNAKEYEELIITNVNKIKTKIKDIEVNDLSYNFFKKIFDIIFALRVVYNTKYKIDIINDEDKIILTKLNEMDVVVLNKQS